MPTNFNTPKNKSDLKEKKSNSSKREQRQCLVYKIKK